MPGVGWGGSLVLVRPDGLRWWGALAAMSFAPSSACQPRSAKSASCTQARMERTASQNPGTTSHQAKLGKVFPRRTCA